MNTMRVVLATLSLVIAVPVGASQTASATPIKLAAACALKSAKTCFEWCEKNGRIGRQQALCVRDCQKKYPGC